MYLLLITTSPMCSDDGVKIAIGPDHPRRPPKNILEKQLNILLLVHEIDRPSPTWIKVGRGKILLVRPSPMCSYDQYSNRRFHRISPKHSLGLPRRR